VWLDPDLHSVVRVRTPVPAAGMLLDVKGLSLCTQGVMKGRLFVYGSGIFSKPLN
jgi:hypothetical protein